MNSFINRETWGILNTCCFGCQTNSKELDEHTVCMSMPVFTYASESATKSTYNGSSTDYSEATKTAYD